MCHNLFFIFVMVTTQHNKQERLSLLVDSLKFPAEV